MPTATGEAVPDPTSVTESETLGFCGTEARVPAETQSLELVRDASVTGSIAVSRGRALACRANGELWELGTGQRVDAVGHCSKLWSADDSDLVLVAGARGYTVLSSNIEQSGKADGSQTWATAPLTIPADHRVRTAKLGQGEVVVVSEAPSGQTSFHWWSSRHGVLAKREMPDGESFPTPVSFAIDPRGEHVLALARDGRVRLLRAGGRRKYRVSAEIQLLRPSLAAGHVLAMDAEYGYVGGPDGVGYFRWHNGELSGLHAQTHGSFQPVQQLFRSHTWLGQIGFVAGDRLAWLAVDPSSGALSLQWSSAVQIAGEAEDAAVHLGPELPHTLGSEVVLTLDGAVGRLPLADLALRRSSDLDLRPRELWLAAEHHREAMSITLVNRGPSALTIEDVELSRNLAGQLRLDQSYRCRGLAPGESLSVGLEWTTDTPAPADSLGSLSVISDDAQLEQRLPIAVVKGAVAVGSSWTATPDKAPVVQAVLLWPTAPLDPTMEHRLLAAIDLFSRGQRSQELRITIIVPDAEAFVSVTDDPYPRLQSLLSGKAPGVRLERGAQRRLLASELQAELPIWVAVDGRGRVRGTTRRWDLAAMQEKLWVALDELRRGLAEPPKPSAKTSDKAANATTTAESQGTAAPQEGASK